MDVAHGGELVAQALKAQGVDSLYTLCSWHITPIYDGCLNHNSAIIDFRHEQAAPLKTKGMGALQEIPQTPLFETITKTSVTIDVRAAIPERLAEAFRLALGGRPVPVFIELAFDILFNAVNGPEVAGRFSPDPIMPDVAGLAQTFDLLRAAEKPLIIAGTQVHWDRGHEALRALTEQTAMPVFTNGGGRGTLAMNHPHCFKASRSAALKEADVVLLIINGDGSFGLNGFEFDTAVRCGLPIVSIVGNDAGWGQIRGPQRSLVGEQRAVATSLAPTRYDLVVEALGGYGELVERPEDLGDALAQAFASGKPACINVSLDPEGIAKTGASSPTIV